ncbi:hypothetical protein MNEG_14192, partial [Monoraphidium neglectum]
LSKQPGPPLTAAQLRQAVAGFSAFSGLPHSPAHPYWRMLQPAGPDEVLETGPEGDQLEVFAVPGGAHDARAHAQQLAGELGDDVDVDAAEPLEWEQR